MTGVLQFAVVGLGAGAAYALLACGLVLIRRGSGVVNFAHGAMAMFAAFLYVDLTVDRGWSEGLALVVVVGFMAAFGAVVYQLVMRPLIKASALSRIIVTLGLLILLQSVAVLIWGDIPRNVNTFLPDQLFRVGDIAVSVDRLLLVVLAGVVTLAVWAAVRFTTLGVALRAVAENRVAASTLGWSPNALGTLTWSAGAGLAALAGVLIAPLTGVAVDTMPFLVIPALAATLVGGFRSLPVTLVAALGIGMLQSIASRYVDTRGVVEALPFLIILLVLVVLRTSAESRTKIVENLPRVGTGQLRPVVVLVSTAVALSLMFVLPTELVHAVIISMSWAIVGLSVVVLLGYAGQLSLAQFALAGLAALIAGRLVSDLQLSFVVALVLGILLIIPVGLIVAVPALRTKGVSLAVVTLGLAVTASAMIFNNEAFTGGVAGTPVGYPTLFGIPIDASFFPERYGSVVILAFVLAALAVSNLRRGASGRRLLAVRTNERAAAALGVNVYGAKLYAFAVSAGLAGLGGILLGFRNPFVIYGDYTPLFSVLVVAFVVVGGVGYIAGAINGGALVAAGIGTWIMHSIVPGAQPVWLSLIGGLMVIVFVVLNPNGLTDDQIHLIKKVGALFRRTGTATVTEPAESQAVTETVTEVKAQHRVVPRTLEVQGLGVRFGGVVALADLDITLAPGEVVGLIGPNGAGKTTFIDAVTGFVSPSGGRILYGDDDITRTPAYRRAQAGVSRSFQSLELFESSTVRENLRVAGDTSRVTDLVRDLVFPRREDLPETAHAAVALLGLGDELDTEVADLSYGRRRLVAIARAVASAPSVLLLDEPAAGLSAEETQALGRVVTSLARDWGIAVLVIEHDLDFVMNVCDRVTVLDFGRVIGRGTPQEIRKIPAVVAAYLGQSEEEVVEDAEAQALTETSGATAEAVSYAGEAAAQPHTTTPTTHPVGRERSLAVAAEGGHA